MSILSTVIKFSRNFVAFFFFFFAVRFCLLVCYFFYHFVLLFLLVCSFVGCVLFCFLVFSLLKLQMDIVSISVEESYNCVIF